jgi:1,4-alpha-glucan branching enzyme
MKPAFAVLAGVALAACVLKAQQPPVLKSPEVRADRTVVFRLWAPGASDVQLSGSWMGSQPPARLTKGGDGVWSVTIGPLEPNIYDYGFLHRSMRGFRCRIGRPRRKPID